jgi:hypothetical protein
VAQYLDAGADSGKIERDRVTFFPLLFRAGALLGAVMEAWAKRWALETADPFFLSPGDFGYLEHLDTREGHHERSHA